MLKTAIFVMMCAALCAAFTSASLTAETLKDLTTTALNAKNVAKYQSSANPLVDTLSSVAQGQLSSMKSLLSSALNGASQTVDFPAGLSESETNALTQTKQMVKQAQEQLNNMNVNQIPAMDSNAEKAMASLLASLKQYNKEATSVQAPTYPTIPSDVTTDLMSLNQGLADFENKEFPKKTISTTRSSMGTQAIKKLLQPSKVPKFKINHDTAGRSLSRSFGYGGSI